MLVCNSMGESFTRCTDIKSSRCTLYLFIWTILESFIRMGFWVLIYSVFEKLVLGVPCAVRTGMVTVQAGWTPLTKALSGKKWPSCPSRGHCELCGPVTAEPASDSVMPVHTGTPGECLHEQLSLCFASFPGIRWRDGDSGAVGGTWWGRLRCVASGPGLEDSPRCTR